MKEGASCPPYNKHLYSEHFLTVMSAFLCIKLTDPSAHTGSHQHLFTIYYWQQNLDIYSWSDVRFDLISPDFFLYLMASESMWTGAMRSSRNLTISRNGLVGCLGNVNFRVISLCTQYKQYSVKISSHWLDMLIYLHSYT